MFLSFQDKDKKTLHTHTSLIDEEKEAKIQKLFDYQCTLSRGGGFFGFYFALEAVNRIKALSHLSLPYRAGIVAGTALVSYIATPKIWWSTSGEKEMRKYLNGAPVYDEFFDVPELDKMYFWLDDDNNYEPSLWHHGMYIILTFHDNIEPKFKSPRSFTHLQNNDSAWQVHRCMFLKNKKL